MYDSPQVANGAMNAAISKEPTPADRLVMDLEQLCRRLDNYATTLQGVADRWHGPLPPNQVGAGTPTGSSAPSPGRLGQLEQLLRSAHGLAQSIENQVDRLRAL